MMVSETGPHRSIAMMSAPSAASRIACAPPCPLAAPVTNATCPSKLPPAVDIATPFTHLDNGIRTYTYAATGWHGTRHCDLIRLRMRRSIARPGMNSAIVAARIASRPTRQRATHPRFLLMSSSQCRIVSNVQDLLHIARCKSGIVPVLLAEAPEGYGGLMADSVSRIKSGFHLRRGDPFSYFVGHRYSG